MRVLRGALTHGRTALAAFTGAPKSDASDVVERALAAVESDAPEVLTDEATPRAKAALSHPPAV
ncbi:hypothetical protein OG552_31075 [Streptomyces sp. NBC_01476]|uniref:hypothetical protein n=1 Tax=Streptomyces sp. NBC_01476 TaxID=2903881 RepID=UPI002E36E7DF|nr:hypothetical protein [Streptomyces sp. NBC_01476]